MQVTRQHWKDKNESAWDSFASDWSCPAAVQCYCLLKRLRPSTNSSNNCELFRFCIQANKKTWDRLYMPVKNFSLPGHLNAEGLSWGNFDMVRRKASSATNVYGKKLFYYFIQFSKSTAHSSHLIYDLPFLGKWLCAFSVNIL